MVRSYSLRILRLNTVFLVFIDSSADGELRSPEAVLADEYYAPIQLGIYMLFFTC